MSSEDKTPTEEYDELYSHFHVVKARSGNHTAAYQKYRSLWRSTAVEHVVTDFPVHLDIEITSHCNLLCTMCPRTHRVQRGEWVDKHMSIEKFRSIIDEGSANGLCAINLNNFGESFMNKNLFQMISYAKEKGIIDVMVHTNGTIMSEKIARKTIDSGLDKLVFSIDSIEKETYENIRVGARYEKVMRNVRLFAKVRREMKKNTPEIRISMVRMKENENELESFDKFWGIDADVITYVDYRNQDGLDDQDRYRQKRKSNKTYACPSLWQRMTINSTGQVTACCRDAGKRLEIGDLNTSPSLLDIWNGEPLATARDLHKRGLGGTLDACNGCDHLRGWQPAQKKTK